MKRKDFIYLLLAVIIFGAAGYIGYTQLVPKKSSGASGQVQVDVVGKIPSQLDQGSLDTLNNPSKVRDYASPLDLNGLNNTNLFGP